MMQPSTTLSLPATLLQAQAHQVASDLVALVTGFAQPDVSIQIDASALSHFDSSALAVLLSCRRAALANGCSLVVLGLPERAKALAKVYGVTELLA